MQWKESVQKFELHLLPNLLKLQKELDSGTYKMGKYLEFDLNERGKKRHIRANNIRDRVVLTALNDIVIMPSISKYLIYDNGASQKGKGISFSENRLKEHLRKYYRKYGNEGYILQIDFEKYFDNIDHEQLKKMLSKYADCDNRTQKLIFDIVDTFCLYTDNSDIEVVNTLELKKGDNKIKKSVAIGNPISQAIGILYATPIDTFCKTVKGCKYYGRYMDDIYIIHSDKEYLKELLKQIQIVANNNKILINTKKTKIEKLSHGFVYLKKKYYLTPTGKVIITLYKGMIQKEKQRLKKLKDKNDLDNYYMSWRNNLLGRYNCYLKIKHIDEYFRRLNNYGETR